MCFGIIGFLAGILYKKGILKNNKLSLCVLAGLSTFFIYGGIINLSNWTKENNKIVIAVLHDLNLVHYFSDNVCLIDKGKVVDYGKSVDVFKSDTLEKVYKVDVPKFMIEVLNKWKD